MLFICLLYTSYQLPMFIVENGFGAIDVKVADGTVNDQYRIDYLRAHIEAMKAAAVSYTHLDVYKRQQLLWGTQKQKKMIN